jgi:uncharacterized protein (TIGR02271 family)
MNDDKKPFDQHDANRDPISGQPGAHPVGTGVGAAGAGAIGAVVGGVVGGPIGAVVGSAVGAVAGGLVGKGAAEQVNPTVEDEYWRNNYAAQPYIEPGRQYEHYQSAYRTGYEGYNRYSNTGKSYNEVEPELQTEYEKTHSGMGLNWEKAKHATRDAWQRAENESIKLYEERLVADKHRVKTGDVTIGKHVETETARVAVPVEKERVVIERLNPTSAGTSVAPGDVAFGKPEVARVELYEETPEIHKEAFVREEVNIRKEVEHEVVNAQEQIRREELDVNTDVPVVDKRPGGTI